MKELAEYLKMFMVSKEQLTFNIDVLASLHTTSVTAIAYQFTDHQCGSLVGYLTKHS